MKGDNKMTVKDLIEMLSKFDPATELVVVENEENLRFISDLEEYDDMSFNSGIELVNLGHCIALNVYT